MTALDRVFVTRASQTLGPEAIVATLRDALARHRPAGDPEGDLEASEPRIDPFSAMTPRFNLPFRWFASRFFRHFDLDDAMVEHLRKLESRGSIIYVMRYASRLDYFLFNVLFIREGLGLSK